MRLTSVKAFTGVFIALAFSGNSLASSLLSGSSDDRQQPTSVKPPSTTASGVNDGLTNSDVLRMVGAKLPEDIILNTIEDAPKKAFDLSASGLISLKSAGVSDEVIRAMQGRPRTAAPTPVSVPSKTSATESAVATAPATSAMKVPCTVPVEASNAEKKPSGTVRLLGGGLLWGRGKGEPKTAEEPKALGNGQPAIVNTALSETEATSIVKAFLDCRNLDFAVNSDSGRILTDWFADRRCGPGFQHCANRASIRVAFDEGKTTIRVQVMERKREGGASEKPWHENSESRGKETAQFAAELDAFLRGAQPAK